MDENETGETGEWIQIFERLDRDDRIQEWLTAGKKCQCGQPVERWEAQYWGAVCRGCRCQVPVR